MTLSVESVVDGGVGGQKLCAEPPLLKRCILRSLLRVGRCEFSARLFIHRPRSWQASIPKVARRRAVRAQVVGDHSIGNEAAFLEKVAHQFQRGVLVPLGLDQHVEKLTLLIDSAPQTFDAGFAERDDASAANVIHVLIRGNAPEVPSAEP